MLTIASIQYVLIVLVTAALYSLSPRQFRPWLLLAVSLVFYGSFNWGFLFLLGGVIGVTFIAGLSIDRYRRARWQVAVWTLAVMTPLLFYKYFLVWFSTLRESFIPVSDFDLEGFGTILIPVGVSFFTFQCLAYIFDIHRGYYSPERRFSRFGLFVAFFPQLLAGPIERWPDLSRQLDKAGRPTPDMVLDGLMFLAYGLFMKLVLADWLGFYVDAAYKDPAASSSIAALIGLYGFPIQLYGDFCGYSLIALGSARLFGIRLTMNFRQPFFSRTIIEFWQRWHISLTRWIGDYLYRPLGLAVNKRKSMPRIVKEIIVLTVTWVAIGMWHGASWPFLIFGISMTVLIFAQGVISRSKKGKPSAGNAIFGVFITFHLVVLTFGLIRAGTMDNYFAIIGAVFGPAMGEIPFTGIWVNIILALLTVMAVDAVRRFRPDYMLKGLYSRTAAIGALLVFIILMGHDEGRTIIYFGF